MNWINFILKFLIYRWADSCWDGHLHAIILPHCLLIHRILAQAYDHDGSIIVTSGLWKGWAFNKPKPIRTSLELKAEMGRQTPPPCLLGHGFKAVTFKGPLPHSWLSGESLCMAGERPPFRERLIWETGRKRRGESKQLENQGEMLTMHI